MITMQVQHINSKLSRAVLVVLNIPAAQVGFYVSHVLLQGLQTPPAAVAPFPAVRYLIETTSSYSTALQCCRV
jgi:hypothetical protein